MGLLDKWQRSSAPQMDSDLRERMLATAPARWPRGSWQWVYEEADSYDCFENLVNAVRVGHDLHPLPTSDDLRYTAEVKAHGMFEHQQYRHEIDAWGGKLLPDFALDRVGHIGGISENIAHWAYPSTGFGTWLKLWMNSPGHRANILNPNHSIQGAAFESGVLHGDQSMMGVHHFA